MWVTIRVIPKCNSPAVPTTGVGAQSENKHMRNMLTQFSGKIGWNIVLWAKSRRYTLPQGDLLLKEYSKSTPLEFCQACFPPAGFPKTLSSCLRRWIWKSNRREFWRSKIYSNKIAISQELQLLQQDSVQWTSRLLLTHPGRKTQSRHTSIQYHSHTILYTCYRSIL